jgi:hypothetical protein
LTTSHRHGNSKGNCELALTFLKTLRGRDLFPREWTSFDHAKARVNHSVLLVDGSRANDEIALRLQAGDPDTLEVDFGDETFVWDPGDGSDTVEGQDGSDTMLFNGANVAEHIDLSANGHRLRFFRDVAGITMDTAGVERVDFKALGGPDTVTVHDLSGTGVDTVNANLAGTLGGNTGNGAADQVILDNTNGSDLIRTAGSNGAATVTGLAATVNVTNAEPANETLTIDALAGNDVVDASALAASAAKLSVDGGNGNDLILGGGGGVLGGGAGDDLLRAARARTRSTEARGTPSSSRTDATEWHFGQGLPLGGGASCTCSTSPGQRR